MIDLKLMNPLYKVVVLGSKGLYLKWKKRPLHINLEISLACNARCPFCNYWKEKPKNETPDSLFEFLKRMNPLMITISGGEPLMRKDLPEYVKKLKKAVPHSYISLISNGSLLTIEKAKELAHAGVSQQCVSLDYLSDHHDKVRRLPGVFSKMKELVPAMTKLPFDRVTLNTIIMSWNLDELVPLAHQAKKWGAYINFSSYYYGKNDNDRGMIGTQDIEKLRKVALELKRLKRKLKNISTSDYFFDRVVSYFKGEEIPQCQAGIKWIQVSPEGYVKRCSEMPGVYHHSDYGLSEDQQFKETDCTTCWFSCRAEVQAPISLNRMRDLVG